MFDIVYITVLIYRPDMTNKGVLIRAAFGKLSGSTQVTDDLSFATSDDTIRAAMNRLAGFLNQLTD